MQVIDTYSCTKALERLRKLHRSREAFQEREQLEQRMEVRKHLTVWENLVQRDWNVAYVIRSGWRDEDLFEISLIYMLSSYTLFLAMGKKGLLEEVRKPVR